MTLKTNVAVQVIAIIIQALNGLSIFTFGRNKVAITLFIGVLQSIVALISHFYNTDGSPQEVPFQKAFQK